jgi:serine/threonine protein kinase
LALLVSDSKICPRCGASYDNTVAFCATDGARLVRGGQTADLIGTVFAERYRVVSRIGEGGMGQVYLAEHVRMKRKSAIKIMRPSLVGEVEALQRFTREAEHASQLSHPNIAAIFDFGETPDGVVYLAMEYVDGESLAAKLDHYSALHPDVAADILGQAADALQAAHDLNMLHRDVKPDNIMLGKRADGTYMVKLVDFGIARTMDGSDQRVTRTGFAVGTPQYMSPEQLAGDTLDARSDQYSLALVAFYSLTGQHAFPADNTKESLIARLTSRARTLQDAKQDVSWPPMLQEVFDRALAPEPIDRFPSVSDFAHALSGAISDMTPTQTAEIYRRALDVRVANVAARTPHSDMELLRTPSGAMSTLRPANTHGVAVAGASGAVPVTSPAHETDARPGTGSMSTTSSRAETARVAADAVTGRGPAANAPAARWPFVIGAVVTVSVVATVLFMRQQGGPKDTAGTSIAASREAGLANDRPAARSAMADSSGISDAAAENAGRPLASTSPPVGTPTPPANPTPNPTPNATPNATPAATKAIRASGLDSAKRLRDSARKAVVQQTKDRADSIARVNSARARFPEAAARAMLAKGVDAKARTSKNDEFRVVIMPTPIFVWRDEQARAWKNAHPAPRGEPFAAVDPIEYWSPWSTMVATRRAVYVMEVTTDRAPWPSYEPEKLYDLKRSDVADVELLRDGVAVPLEAGSRVPSLVNAAAHSQAGRRVPNAFVATLAPTTFVPRDDGTMPKFELVVHDAMRNGAATRITINATIVKRLYDDFAPWRDALVRQ